MDNVFAQLMRDIKERWQHIEEQSRSGALKHDLNVWYAELDSGIQQLVESLDELRYHVCEENIADNGPSYHPHYCTVCLRDMPEENSNA